VFWNGTRILGLILLLVAGVVLVAAFTQEYKRPIVSPYSTRYTKAPPPKELTINGDGMVIGSAVAAGLGVLAMAAGSPSQKPRPQPPVRRTP